MNVLTKDIRKVNKMKTLTNKQLNSFVSAIDMYREKEVSVQLGESVLNISVKPLLTIDEFSAYVRSVVDAVFDETGYRADVLDYANKKATIAFYTNLGSGFSNKVLNAILYVGELYEVIQKVINQSQYSNLMDAVKDAVDYRKNMVYADHQYGAAQIKSAIVAEHNEIVQGIELLMKEMKLVSQQFNPETQKISLDFMKHVNNMDEKTLAHNLIEFNEAQKRVDSNE